MKIKINKLTGEQLSLLIKINRELKHTWNYNVSRIIKQGTYTNCDKIQILNPLRKQYIEHLKNIKS